MFGLDFTMTPALRRVIFLSLIALAGCGGANACCTPPGGVNRVGGVIPPGAGPQIVPSVPAITIGVGIGAPIGVPIIGTGPFTVVGCPGIVNATVNGNVIDLTGVGVGTCVVVVTSPGGGQGTITVTVAAGVPIVATPGTISLLPGGTGGFTLNGPGPFTAVGCPGIINATVTGNIVNLVAVGVGVCAVVVTGPGGIQTVVGVTVAANTPLGVNPGIIQLGVGGTGNVAITGTGPFTASSCPGIINATVTGNVLNLVAAGVGVCVILVTGPNGVTATVVATVVASTPLTVTPPSITLGPNGTGSVVVTGQGPFTATGCPGIINAMVSGNVVNLVGVNAGVCVIVITGPGGVQATVLATVLATTPPIALSPTAVQLGNGGTSAIAITGTGPFTATGCPGIINASVTGNVLNLVAVGVGVCAVVVIGPTGAQATVLATVLAAAPLVVTPATANLVGIGSVSPVTVTGTGPFTATGCPGIVTATVSGNIVNLTETGIGVCAVVIVGAGGVQATVLVTAS